MALENTCSALVGIPFKDGGRTPSEGFDCWGLVAFVFALRGRPVEDYLVSASESAMIDSLVSIATRSSWKQVPLSDLEELDVLTFRLDANHPRFVTHVGIYVGGGRFLHALQKVGVNQSRIEDIYWKARCAGAFRRTA